jgi:cobalt-zinc-cadmium resistance protein CzcA
MNLIIQAALRLRWVVLLLTLGVVGFGVWAFQHQPIDAYPDISAQMVQVITVYPGRAPEEVERQVTIPVENAMLGVPRVETVRSRTIFGLSVVQMTFEEGTEMYWARQRVTEKLGDIDLPAGVQPQLGPPSTAYGEIYRYELVSDGTVDLIELRTLNDWVVERRLKRVAGVAEVANFGGYVKQYALTFNQAQLKRYGLALGDVEDAITKNNAAGGGSVVSRGSMSLVVRGKGQLENLDQIQNIFIKSIAGTPIYLKDLASVSIDSKVPNGIFSKDYQGPSVQGIVTMRKGENPSQVLARVQEAVKDLNETEMPRWFKLTDKSFAALRDEEVPEKVLDKLIGLKDREFESQASIAKEIAECLPTQDAARLQGLVLNHVETGQRVRIVSYYDRTHLIDATLHTVTHSVGLGITLVVLVLIFFLGRPAMALLVALTIPFALLFALICMYLTNIPVGLLSIGAIDFGIIVDGAVIMAENIARRLGESGRHDARGALAIIRGAALDMQRPVFISVFLIMVAFLPLLSLTRIEGLLFRPMAMTILFALSGALIFALVLVPVLASFLFRHGYEEWENPLLRWFTPLYAWVLRGLLQVRWLAAILSVAGLVVVLVLLVPRLGTEFLPYLDEGVLWVRANFPEGTSLEQTSAYGQRLREIALEFPDIKFAIVQAGRNDDGTDPFPPSRIEMMIGPRPREHWQQFRTKQELITALRARYREEFPTTRFNFTQPIIDSVTEDTNGTSANLAVDFSGPKSEVLQELAGRTVELLRTIPGAVDVSVEQEGPQPQLIIQPDRALCARFNVRIEDVMKLVNMAIGGEPVSTLYEGERRFEIVARLDKQSRNSPQAIGRLPVYTADGVPIPLGQVATIEVRDGQTLIARGDGRRRLTVRCDIVGRDQGGFVREAQERFELEVTLPAGYRVEWLGMFENLARAFRHFMILIPTTIGIIFLVLIVAFGSFRAAFILLLPLPFAFASGALALYLRSMNLNVSTGVGFATLFGIAIMDGVLMFKGITKYRLQGATVDEAIIHGRIDRLRPSLMTSLVAILGLLPAALATGLGSDVQRPLATVIVCGLTGSALFTLFVTPVFYRIFVPPLAEERAGARAEPVMEPLPDVSAIEVIGLLEYLDQHQDEEAIVRIAENTNREFARVVYIVKASEMLDFIDTPLHMVVLTPKGKQFVEATPEHRKELWRDQLLSLSLFREVSDVLQRQPGQVVDSDFVLETIVTRMPYENYEKVFQTFVRWARFGELFTYDERTQRISLFSPGTA